MAKTNVELSYETLGAYLRGDEETLRALMHPEAEIYGHPEIVNAGTYHGFDGFQRWIREWEEARRFHVYPTVELALEAAGELAEQ